MNENAIEPQLRDKLRDVLANYIKSKNMRNTLERFSILDHILQLQDHFNIDQLYEAIEPQFHVSKATVYNTVELLCDCNILRKHFFNENQAVYELCEHHHHHLVCTSCGGLNVVDNKSIDSFIGSIGIENFNPEFSALTIYGKCNPCAAKKQPAPSQNNENHQNNNNLN